MNRPGQIDYHPLPPDWIGDEHELRINLVGCGGNGSQMLTGLARLHTALTGLGHPGFEVQVFDDDRVSDSNVGRQLFSPADVGHFKADVLVHRINCYYGLHWKSLAHRYDSRETYCDIVIGCVDSIAARRKIYGSDYKYWLDLGNRDRTGQVILGQPTQRAAVRPGGRSKSKSKVSPAGETRGSTPWDELHLRNFFEVYPELLKARVKEDTAPSCSLAQALERQDLFINQIVASFALNLLWRFLREGRTAVAGAFINLETGKVTPLPVRRVAAPILKGKP